MTASVGAPGDTNPSDATDQNTVNVISKCSASSFINSTVVS